MSLALLQGYSSAEEETHEASAGEDDDDLSSSSSLEGGEGGISRRGHPKGERRSYRSPARASPNSLLPSAFDVFAEVSGPPEFLNNCVGAEEGRGEQKEAERRGRNHSRDKKDLPFGAVLESKAQLVGIRDRVRSDVEGSAPVPGSGNTISGEGKQISTAANPDAKDAADLLRMCLQCGIPKTYNHTRGMVCPQCSDRPQDMMKEKPEKKKGSIIKDKEKSKRMRGQSSHATWKSETEMQLRQQFD